MNLPNIFFQKFNYLTQDVSYITVKSSLSALEGKRNLDYRKGQTTTTHYCYFYQSFITYILLYYIASKHVYYYRWEHSEKSKLQISKSLEYLFNDIRQWHAVWVHTDRIVIAVQ